MVFAMFSLPNRFFGVFPNLFSIFVFQSPAVFGQVAVALEKVAWRVPQLCYKQLFPKWLETSANFSGEICFSVWSMVVSGARKGW